VRLIALVESESHVCCRYRLTAFQSALTAHGHKLELRPLPHSILGRLALGRDLAAYDAVILQRKLLPRWVIARLRARVPRLIFDFDDAVWLRDSYSTKGFEDPKRASRFRATIAACDLVIAGNEYLAAAARNCNSSARIHVIPTCLDPSRYPQAQHQAQTGIRLVWVGSSSTLTGLERFGRSLSAIGAALPGTKLKLICDRFTEFPGLIVERCPWSEATEAAELAAGDIGISSVPDDPWSRGKCGLKLLQYQAAGLPVVANPVGVQAEFVRSGATGFLAHSMEEWVSAVRTLAIDPSLRTRFGATARQQVVSHFSVGVGTRLWVQALANLAGTKRIAG
jgi:glycosyltransferase involved in cell wall biosynthesis